MRQVYLKPTARNLGEFLNSAYGQTACINGSTPTLAACNNGNDNIGIQCTQGNNNTGGLGCTRGNNNTSGTCLPGQGVNIG